MTVSAPASFHVRAAGPLTIATFAPPWLDDETIRTLGPDLDRLADQPGQAELRLDFGRVEYLSSAGLGKLVSVNKRVTAAGGRLVLTDLAPHLFELFQITRLDTILDVRQKDAAGAGPVGGDR